MTFDISERLPFLGQVLFFGGILCAILGCGVQLGAWIG